MRIGFYVIAFKKSQEILTGPKRLQKVYFHGNTVMWGYLSAFLETAELNKAK